MIWKSRKGSMSRDEDRTMSKAAKKFKKKKSISWAVLVDNAENARKPIDGRRERLEGMQRTAGVGEEMR